jgi:hypothetical protein
VTTAKAQRQVFWKECDLVHPLDCMADWLFMRFALTAFGELVRTKKLFIEGT